MTDHRRRSKTIKKAVQVAAIGHKRAHPNTHKAAHMLLKQAAKSRLAVTNFESTVLAAAVAAAERGRTRHATKADLSTAVQSPEEWARAFHRSPAAYITAAEAASQGLWEHQRTLVDAILHRERNPFEGAAGSILAEEMGNGKTRVVLQCVVDDILSRLRSGEPRFGHPTLVVVPKSLLLQWMDEIRKFYSPHVLAVDRIGADGSTDAAQAALGVDRARVMFCLDLVLTTYDTLMSGYRSGASGGLFDIPWRRLVVDEGTLVANERNDMALAAEHLHTAFRLFVCGTPFSNSYAREQNAVFKFLGCHARVSNILDATNVHGATAPTDDVAAAERERTRILVNLMLRTTEATRTRPPDIQWVFFRTPEERAEYEHFQRLSDAEPERFFEWATVLRKLTTSRNLLLNKDELAALGSTRPVSAKIQSVITYIKNRMGPAEKGLVFSEWKRPLQELSFHLTAAGISNDIMSGDMTIHARQALITRFTDEGSDEPQILLLPYRIGAMGLNLQRANHVLLLAGHWHPGLENQAFGRISRRGQQRQTHFVKFVHSGTIDATILDINQGKNANGSAMFNQYYMAKAAKSV